MEYLQVGDVFFSEDLADANFTMNPDGSVNRKEVEVNGPMEITRVWTETKEGGWKRSREDIVNLDGRDSGRGIDEFVVIHTEMSGGGTGHGPGDIYPEGWGVRAKRLKVNGEWDPEGEEVFFRQSGSFTNTLKNITKTRRMKVQFVSEQE